MMFDKEMEEEFTQEKQGKIVQFINDFDPQDERDPYYVAEIIFGANEEDIRKWVDEDKKKRSFSSKPGEPKTLQKDLKRIVHSLESIRKSVIKLDEYNKQLIDELKKKIKKEPE